MALWEQLLIGVVVLLVLLWLRPGIKGALKRSREATERDWSGALIPVAVVVLFVLLLVAMVRG